MFIRSKAPLRLGIAGGGSDVSPYSDVYGGAILNATINMFAFATIEPLDTGNVIFHAVDLGEEVESESKIEFDHDGILDLHKGVYNRIIRDFVKEPLSFKLSTSVDAPPGSGLGSSSTLVVAIIGAFVEWLKLPLGEYDIARLAYDIERVDLGFAGGKQDQYAATFGGFNFMEFYANDKVIVNPLRIKRDYVKELEFNLVLYHTTVSRLSSQIIEQQVNSVGKNQNGALGAMHHVKEIAFTLKEALLKGNLGDFGPCLHQGWMSKKATAEGITNKDIDFAYQTALEGGASGGKVSGAGGGGFIMFYCPGNTRYKVVDRLLSLGGDVRQFSFTEYGLTTWSV